MGEKGNTSLCDGEDEEYGGCKEVLIIVVLVFCFVFFYKWEI